MKRGFRLIRFILCALTALFALYLCLAGYSGWLLPDALKTPLPLSTALMCLCFIALTLARLRVKDGSPETGLFLLLAGYVFLVFGAVRLIGAAAKAGQEDFSLDTDAYAFAALSALAAAGGRSLCPDARPSRLGRAVSAAVLPAALAVFAFWLFGKNEPSAAFGSLSAMLAVAMPALPGIVLAKKGADSSSAKALARINAAVIDERLENGPGAIKIIPAQDVSEDMLVSLAAGALSGLERMPPALEKLAKQKNLPLDPVSRRDESDDGVRALLGESLVLAGSADFLAANGVKCEGEGLNVALNGKYMGQLISVSEADAVSPLVRLARLIPLYSYRGGKQKKAVRLEAEDGKLTPTKHTIRLKTASVQKRVALISSGTEILLPDAGWTGDDPESFLRELESAFGRRKSLRRRACAYLAFEAAALVLAAGALRLLLGVTLPFWIFPLAAFAAGLALTR
ncbi:MAG: hypothetical protein K5663_10655 [Clostridiales bacterium]|nr:hypothetical protein [Clostridiales bacterium]